MKVLEGAAGGGLADEALEKYEAMDSQPLATLVDINLPGCALLEDRLSTRVKTFADRWRREDALKASNALLFEWQVDNFGIFGTTLLLNCLGIGSPGIGFEQRALRSIAAVEAARSDDWRKQRFFFKERVYCYAEFALRHPKAEDPDRLQGTMIKENSFLGEGTRAGRTGLLRSTSLPINELVDRTLCAEFQTLAELCDLLDVVGITGNSSRRFVTGKVSLWTTGASCLSCVGTMRQFLQLFPSTTLEVKCAKRFV